MSTIITLRSNVRSTPALGANLTVVSPHAQDGVEVELSLATVALSVTISNILADIDDVVRFAFRVWCRCLCAR